MFNRTFFEYVLGKYDMSVEELSERIGISNGRLKSKIDGRIKFTLADVRKIQNVFNLGNNDVLNMFFYEINNN